MGFLSKLSGTQQRPRLAAELRSRAVVVAAADSVAAPIRAVAHVGLPETALAPSLKIPNIVDRIAVGTALRSALERVASTSRDLTLIVPDPTVRVVLLDFDALPTSSTEAESVVRFRLKRTIPFDADSAALSYQVIQQSKGSVNVLAVVMPSDLRDEYERIVREAGYEPGAILPSTLAALSALDPTAPKAQLLLNVDETAMTTAIIKGGALLLYRTVEFAHVAHEQAALPEPVLADATSALAEIEAEVLLGEVEHLSHTDEIARAVSVATAYFEDTLGELPDEILIAGAWPVGELQEIAEQTVGSSVRLREIVHAEDLLATATSAPRNLLAGLRGALKG